MTTPPRRDEYILPDLGWAILLDRIVLDARPGSVLVTYSEIMRVVCQQTIDDAGRADLTVELRLAPTKGWQQ